MNSSDGISSIVGVVSFATVDKKRSDDDATVDGNGGVILTVRCHPNKVSINHGTNP
jgi:hypothetical protein